MENKENIPPVAKESDLTKTPPNDRDWAWYLRGLEEGADSVRKTYSNGKTIEQIMSDAFVAGRSKMTWETFKNEYFLTPKTPERVVITGSFPPDPTEFVEKVVTPNEEEQEELLNENPDLLK